MSLDKVLILDDEPIVRKALEEMLRRKKLTVSCAGSVMEAEALLQKDAFDLLFVDVRLPDGDGQQFLEHLTQQPEHPMVVMMTGYGSIESAVACMRAGAFDYIIKPFNVGQIDIVLKKVESFRQLVRVNRYLTETGGAEGDLVGRSPAMLRLHQMIQKVAPTEATVLITGENGTGKERVARELYRHSARKAEPYIQVNCAAVSENLIESEFFGHEKGAFTGATERREGRFELANRGTLLLDEVSEIPLHLQAKLLRVLQEREFERVGGNKTIKVNVRILATSNRDLLKFVESGRFRQDLYYRLNVFPIHVPALRDRREDIPFLAEHFLRRFARKQGMKIPGFTEASLRALSAYLWPGNVRELQNTIERAVILTEQNRPVSVGALGLPDLSAPAETGATTVPFVAPGARTPAPSAPPSEAFTPADVEADERAPVALAVSSGEEEILPLDELEKRHIFSALRQTGGNRTQAAALLKISIRTLRNKLHEYREAGEFVEGEGEAAEG